MLLFDVNVLVSAFREDSPDHSDSIRAVELALESGHSMGWNCTQLSAVVRIVTNPKAFDPPAPLEIALAYCNHVVAWPQSVQIEPGQRFMRRFGEILRDSGRLGPHTSDAFFAALAIEHSATWITWDRDFRSYTKLDCRVLESGWTDLKI